MLKAKNEKFKNALFAVIHFKYEKTGNNSTLVLLIMLQQTMGYFKMISIFKV